MSKRFIGIVVSLFLILFPGTCLSQLVPPFKPSQPPINTTALTQRYTSEQYKFSFDYPQGWKVQEQQGAVNVSEPQNLAWVTMWRITQNVDPQTYLQNVESQLKQNWQNYTVTSRSEVKINSIDALRVEGEATSQGKVLVFTLLVLYQNNQAKFIAGSEVIKEQYTNLSPILEKIFNSIILLEETGTQVPSQPTQQPAETTPQPSGDGSEGIKLLRNLARGGNPPPLPQFKPPSDWVHVSHPTIFILKLIRPPDWKEEIIQDPSGYYGGLKIISPDGQANLHVYYGVVFGAITLNEGIREGIYLLTGSYPEVEFVVEDNLHKFVSAMWPGADARFVAFRHQGKVGVLLCMIFPMSGGQVTQVHLKGCIGPTEKFDSLTKEIFMKVFGWVGAGGYITPPPSG
jgi:hypothetical protein